jgi:hypothetical protein
MKKVLVVLSLMLFVGSLSTSVYAAVSTDQVELHKDDKKKKKKGACCSEKDAKSCTKEEKKSCDKAQNEGAKACCSKSASNTEKK